MIRSYAAGVDALHNQKRSTQGDRQSIRRQADAQGVEEHYRDCVANLDRIPRVESEAIATIPRVHGKPGIPHETFVDDSIVETDGARG